MVASHKSEDSLPETAQLVTIMDDTDITVCLYLVVSGRRSGGPDVNEDQSQQSHQSHHPQAIIRLPFDNLTLLQAHLQSVSRHGYSQSPQTCPALTLTDQFFVQSQ